MSECQPCASQRVGKLTRSSVATKKQIQSYFLQNKHKRRSEAKNFEPYRAKNVHSGPFVGDYGRYHQ